MSYSWDDRYRSSWRRWQHDLERDDIILSEDAAILLNQAQDIEPCYLYSPLYSLGLGEMSLVAVAMHIGPLTLTVMENMKEKRDSQARAKALKAGTLEGLL
jgi:hypothetical protein